ncbi:MAG: M1 family metallopeptidase [Verrucomicrobia bacterium]|nr:M1 family metallopeptidase [Verrucomicrobiota bacterium]
MQRCFSFHLPARLLLGLAVILAAAPSALEAMDFGAEASLLCRHGAPSSSPESAEHRRYAPDRKADILHLALDVTPDFQQRTVAGTATLTFKPIAKPLDELRLDAVDLTVLAVTASEKIAAHQVTGREIIVTFAAPIAPDKEVKLAIQYRAEPRRGLYFRTPEMGYKAGDLHIFTQGEADEARHWYPSHDYPNEKFTSEITCRVPEGMVVLSNGRKVSEAKDPQSGLVAVRWSQDKPHVNYLLSLVAGHFKKVEDKYRDIPLEFYTPPSDINEAPASFRDTKDAMAFFEKEIGVPYPWAKYAQVVVHDFHFGGMENTSITTLTDRTLHQADTEALTSSAGLVSHELAHQWFGDLVTCKDWSHVWLNEGFATYYAHLFEGHQHGRDAMLWGLYNDARGVLAQTNDTRPVVQRRYDDPNEQFGFRAYPKGGWVLHMMRAELGDDLYRRCIQTYLVRHQFKTVVTEDLRAVVEELSGRNYDQFFDQWLYHGGQPELDVIHSWDEKSKLAKVTVKQAQKIGGNVPLFRLPLTIRFTSKSGAVDHRVTVKEKEEDFYCPLKEAPQIVRIDPELALLAKVTFKPSAAMLHAQLAAKDDAMGRAIAAEQLGLRKDRDSVAKLKQALSRDAFFGVRVKAAEALRSIHSDEALDALLASLEQPDARVRDTVVNAIAGFYNPKARETLLRVAAAEKNPAISATAIRGLGKYNDTQVNESLTAALNSNTYRQRKLDAAVAAIRDQDSASWAETLRGTITKRGEDFSSFALGNALDALASLNRAEQKKDSARAFLAGFVNSKKQRVKTGALRALGTLGDDGAIPLLETFAQSAKNSPEQKEAEAALAKLRGAQKPGDNLKDLRKELSDVKEENRKLRKEFDELKQRLDAKK